MARSCTCRSRYPDARPLWMWVGAGKRRRMSLRASICALALVLLMLGLGPPEECWGNRDSAGRACFEQLGHHWVGKSDPELEIGQIMATLKRICQVNEDMRVEEASLS